MLKKFIFFLICGFLMIIFTSCKTTINITDHINQNQSFTVVPDLADSLIKKGIPASYEIEPNSEKFKKIIQWCNENKKGWRPTPVTYIDSPYLTQNGFHLLYLHGAVAIEFMNKQYTKPIPKDELKFLFDH
jgi:hypothetical protein